MRGVKVKADLQTCLSARTVTCGASVVLFVIEYQCKAAIGHTQGAQERGVAETCTWGAVAGRECRQNEGFDA